MKSSSTKKQKADLSKKYQGILDWLLSFSKYH